MYALPMLNEEFKFIMIQYEKQKADNILIAINIFSPVILFYSQNFLCSLERLQPAIVGINDWSICANISIFLLNFNSIHINKTGLMTIQKKESCSVFQLSKCNSI